MPRTPQDVTDAELVYPGSPLVRRRIDHSPVDRPPLSAGYCLHYATVQKLLERLEAKGYVDRRRQAAAHVFVAAVPRDELLGRRLQATAEKLCGGSLTPLIMHLVRTNKLSARERQELRALIDELERAGRHPKTKG